ncbi:MAG: DUF2157 domain-containing protein [Acidimicrobiales bacterium]|jgi:hypothetical protein|nr:DUF2157 domain-containing protein [Acidimicrobiales bacterium]
MIALGVLVFVLIVAAVAVTTQKQGHGSRHPDTAPAMGRAATAAPASGPPRGLEAQLRGWRTAGLITDDQVAAILALEGGVAVGAAPRQRRVSVVAELLGYLGGVLLLIGVFTLIAQFWSDLTTVSRLALVGAAAVGFGVAGAFVHEDLDPALWRLRGFLWLFSTAATALFVGLFAADVADVSPQATVLSVGCAAAVQSGLLWWRQVRPLQHLATFAGIVAAGVGLGVLLEVDRVVAFLALWSLGAAWALLGWRDLLPPRVVAMLLGVLAVLVAPNFLGSDESQAGLTLAGLATACALLVLGTTLREYPFTIGGMLGLLVYLPWTTAYFFGDTVGVPVVILLSGAVVLAVAVLLLRRGGPGAPTERPDETRSEPAEPPAEVPPTVGTGASTEPRPAASRPSVETHPPCAA